MANRSYILTRDMENPKVGDLCHGKDIGHTGNRGFDIYIFVQCPHCQNLRWAVKRKWEKSKTKFCQSCHYATYKAPPPKKRHRGESHSNWKGGRVNLGTGYIGVRIYKDSPYWSMAINKAKDWDGAYVLEHRLIMAQYLGRSLESWEVVHHHNHNRYDNRIENLELVPTRKHQQITILENRIKILEARITQLEAEIIILKSGESVYYG